MVIRLEALLHDAQGRARLDALVPLAWHLRQRDSARARELVAEAQALWAQVELPSAVYEQYMARLALVGGEINILFGDWGAAQSQVQQALRA